MPRADRSRRVRAFARDISDRTQTTIEATYDTGARWYLHWTDGPIRSGVRADAEAADLAGAQITTSRSLSARAIAVGAVRLAAAGELSSSRRWGSDPVTFTWKVSSVRDGTGSSASPIFPDQRALSRSRPANRSHPY
jgi:hypothetical protein